MFTARGKIPETYLYYIYTMIAISENPRNAWSFYYIRHGSFGLYVFRNERLLNILSLLLQDFLLLSCLHVQHVVGMRITVPAKANNSREKQITHGKIRSRQKLIQSSQKKICSRQKQIAHSKSKSTQNAIFL